MIKNSNILNENYYSSNTFSNNYWHCDESYEYLNDFKQIHKFFIENTVPKYNLRQCIMKENSVEPGIDAEYYFFLKDNLNSKEVSKLSLKINSDLYYFCKMQDNQSFFKTLIIISR